MINNIQSVAQLYGVNQKKTAVSTQSGVGRTATDEVVLSQTAQSFAQMLQKAQKSMGDVRQDRVEALTRQIADGTYQIDARAIADKLMQYGY